jgi:hypothetical protein
MGKTSDNFKPGLDLLTHLTPRILRKDTTKDSFTAFVCLA